MEMVTGLSYHEPVAELPESGLAVIAGALGSSPWIDQLAEEGKIPAGDLAGKWEKFIIKTI